jgi:hypothetical protein
MGVDVSTEKKFLANGKLNPIAMEDAAVKDEELDMDALVEALIEQETLDEISFNKIVQAYEKDFSPQQPLAQCSPHPQR